MEKKHQKYIASAAAAIVALIMIPILFVTFVGEHEVGVAVRNGQIVGERRTGLNLTMPVITHVRTIPITAQQGAIEDVSSATIDNYEALIESELEDATKDVIGQYRLMAISENREQIGEDIAEAMRERLTDEMGVEFRTAALAYYEWTSDAANILSEIQEA